MFTHTHTHTQNDEMEKLQRPYSINLKIKEEHKVLVLINEIRKGEETQTKYIKIEKRDWKLI